MAGSSEEKAASNSYKLSSVKSYTNGSDPDEYSSPSGSTGCVQLLVATVWLSLLLMLSSDHCGATGLFFLLLSADDDDDDARGAAPTTEEDSTASSLCCHSDDP